MSLICYIYSEYVNIFMQLLFILSFSYIRNYLKKTTKDHLGLKCRKGNKEEQ